MDTVRALQEANSQYRREQEKIQQKAKVEQLKLMEKAKAEQQKLMAKAKVELEKLIAEAQAEKVLMQDQLMAEIDASRAISEELRKINEDLRKSLQQRDQRSTRERGLNAPLRTRPIPFSRVIMDELVPPHYIMPNIVFTGVEDPENHLRVFNTHMIIFGGTDAIYCKMFLGTFTGTALQWFSGLPDGHITSFNQFSELFREQFFINQVKPLILYDLFSVRQRKGESLKNYLNRFWTLTMKLQTHDEVAMVNAFKQGIMAGPFSDSLIRNPAKTFAEIRRRVFAHINTEDVVSMKHNNSYSR